MRSLIVLFAVLGSLVACETHGVVDSSYDGTDGSHLSLRQFRSQSRFYYALSASLPSGDCSVRELRVVAMGQGRHVRVRFEHSPTGAACDS